MAYKQYRIRYIVQESKDGVLWHDVADCMSEEEAVQEVIELQDNELKRKEDKRKEVLTNQTMCDTLEV